MVNGKRYIGRKIFDTGSRWKSYLGSGNHFRNAVSTHGKENFVRNIVDIAYSEKELNEKEKEWIDQYNAVKDENYYNMIEGGYAHESLKRKNSIKVICIDNNKVFDSLNESSMWSGQTVPMIKKSFKNNHTYDNYKNENYIFRLLPNTKLHKRVCCICGKFLSDERHWCKMCSKCDFEVKKASKLKKCKDCTKSFNPKSNRQTRCEDCQNNRNKDKKKEYARIKRQKEKLSVPKD